MYRNTFDDEERDQFANRLEAAKQEDSHYHKTLVQVSMNLNEYDKQHLIFFNNVHHIQQLEHAVKISGLKVDFEIRGKQEREGGGNNREPIPIIYFGAEGDGGEHDLNDRLFIAGLEPGNGFNAGNEMEENDRVRNGAAYEAIAQPEIEMQIFNQMNDEECKEESKEDMSDVNLEHKTQGMEYVQSEKKDIDETGVEREVIDTKGGGEHIANQLLVNRHFVDTDEGDKFLD